MGFKIENNHLTGAIYIGKAINVRIDGNPEDGFDIFPDRMPQMYPPMHCESFTEALSYIQALDAPEPAERDAAVMRLRQVVRQNLPGWLN